MCAEDIATVQEEVTLSDLSSSFLSRPRVAVKSSIYHGLLMDYFAVTLSIYYPSLLFVLLYRRRKSTGEHGLRAIAGTEGSTCVVKFLTVRQ